MLSPDSAMPSIAHRHLAAVSELQQARGYFDEEEEEQSSDVSVMILHMSELLSSFVREDPPEKRAEWAAALAEMRNSIDSVHKHEELRFIADFSIMLEDGLQCMAEKCARLEQAVNASPRKHGVSGRTAVCTASAAAAPYHKGEQRGSKIHSTPVVARTPKKEHAMVQLVACDLCSEVVPRPRYGNHLRHAHPEEFEKMAKFRCSFCKSAHFIKEAALKAHLEVCHVRLEHLSYRKRLPPSDEHACRMCSVQCGTLRQLAEHTEKDHPHCQILSCSGCAVLFRHPDAIIAHWKEAKANYASKRCADGAVGTLVTRTKLIGQMLAHAKASDNSFTYVECMKQNIACLECGFKVDDFKKIYTHVHSKHRRDVQSSLMFGCLGCGGSYRCSQGLREHLLRAEIEKFEACCNAGVVYWDEKPISKDMRPPEAMKAQEEMMEEEDAVVELEDTPAMGDGRLFCAVIPKKEEVEEEEEDKKKEVEEKKEEGEERMEEEENKDGKEEKEEKKEERKGEKWEAEMKDELKIKIKRTSVVQEPIAEDSMEIDTGFNSMDDMPSLEHFEEIAE